MRKLFMLLVGLGLVSQNQTLGFRPPLCAKPLETTFVLAYNPSGKILATAGTSGTVWLRVGSSKRSLQRSQKPIRSLAWLDDSKLIAAGDDDIARVWNVSTGQIILELRGHRDWIRSVASSADYLVTGSDDGTARVWKSTTGALYKTLRGLGEISSLSFAGQYLAIGSTKKLQLWDLASGKTIWRVQTSVSSLAVSPDQTLLATGSPNGTSKLWAVVTGKLTRVFKAHDDQIRAIAFSPNGQSLATGSDDASLGIWQVASGKLIRRIRGHVDWIRSLAFSPDGQTLVSSGDDQKIRFWVIDLHDEPLLSKGVK